LANTVDIPELFLEVQGLAQSSQFPRNASRHEPKHAVPDALLAYDRFLLPLRLRTLRQIQVLYKGFEAHIGGFARPSMRVNVDQNLLLPGEVVQHMYRLKHPQRLICREFPSVFCENLGSVVVVGFGGYYIPSESQGIDQTAE
jgi:hypothetical protein